MSLADEHIAYVLDESGITPVRFRPDDDLGALWTNVEAFSLPPGALLWFGAGVEPIDDLVIFPGEYLTVVLVPADIEESPHGQ